MKNPKSEDVQLPICQGKNICDVDQDRGLEIVVAVFVFIVIVQHYFLTNLIPS